VLQSKGIVSSFLGYNLMSTRRSREEDKTFQENQTNVQRILTTGRITYSWFIGRPIGTLVDSTRGNPDVTPSKVLLPVKDMDPHLTD